MTNIRKYVRKAAASKRADFTLPVIDSADDALRAAREVAESLKRLPEAEQLALLSDLDELSKAIDARVEVLQNELAETGAKLKQVRFGRKVCDSYAQRAGGVIRLDAKRRPSCP